MKKIFSLIIVLSFTTAVFAQAFTKTEIANWKKQAETINIIRDNWGVPHIYTNTDADAVFGMMYVQCEDFFLKVENAIISRMGREAEVQGKKAIYKDLWSRLYIDTIKAAKLYQQCPPSLKKLCDAYAAGINYFIYTHPAIKPALLNRIQPWVPLLNNIPSIVNSNITEAEIKKMYPMQNGVDDATAFQPNPMIEETQMGSNGWAIAGKNTHDKNAIILINPHSEFYNRIEVQLVSKEGLNVYGAPFLGEFHIWQGFNEFCGWMHTVTTSDAKDLYSETIHPIKNGYEYSYDNKWIPVDSNKITLYFTEGAKKNSVTFTTYKTKHGPVVAKRNNSWLSAKTINENIELLNVHWNITKSKTYKQFVSYLDKRVMTGTNTIYADKSNNIAYWHGNFVPVRNTNYDWTRPVPGNVSTTEWHGPHALSEIPNYINPTNGWVQNCNSSPLYGNGYFDSIMAKKPSYMFPDGHTPRAMNAIRQLSNIKDATIDTIINMCHDTYLFNASRFIPTLIESYKQMNEPTQLKEQIEILKKWNFRTDTSSVATTLCVLWIEKMLQLNIAQLKKPISNEESYALTNGSNISLQKITPAVQVAYLDTIVNELKKDWGTWSVAWGKINRYQRNDKDIDPSDSLPSKAVFATPAYVGSLNAFSSKKTKVSRNRYGATGNTFVAIVSFGNRLSAKSILTGGASSNPSSKHFLDQSNGYINHEFKVVNFYKEDVLKNKEINYHPGENIY
jgi:acyl-homoserine-lactone acylase